MYDDVLCTFLKTRQHKTTTTATLVKIDPWLFGCVTLHPRRLAMFWLSYLLKNKIFHPMYNHLSTQSSLSIFAQKYHCKCENTYFILQNKYLCIYDDSFGAMILRDDCALRNMKMKKSFSKGPDAMSVSLSCLQSKLYFHLNRE